MAGVGTPYWDWIRAEAAKTKSDGCTLVTDFRVECCYEHDLHFFYAKDARSAYRCFRRGALDPWASAAPITFDETNLRFRKCYQKRSWFRFVGLGKFSPVAWIRWTGVQSIFGKRLWDKRRREREQEKELKKAA